MQNELVIAFGVFAICVVMHSFCLLLLGKWLVGKRVWLENHGWVGVLAPILILVSTVITILHLSEAALWAGFYRLWSLFPDYESALYFSLTSFTTIGYGDVLMPEKWRLLGCIEGLTGVLLSGLSTAFLFVILSAVLRILTEAEQSSE
jgi:hypothetical protein